MRNFIKFTILAAALAMAASCETSKVPGEENVTGNVKYEGTDPDCYEFAINATEGDFNASENGVSIKIANVQLNNVVFTLMPGESIRSYRVDIYPKALLYNALLEGGLVDASEDEVEEFRISLLES